MESTGMVQNVQTLISLQSAQDFPSVCGYTVTDLFYQQPAGFSFFPQFSFSYCFNFLTFLSPLAVCVLGTFR